MKILIVGAGNVGRMVGEIAQESGDESTLFPRPNSLGEFLKAVANHDAVCLTISTKDTGEEALWYIRQTMLAGKKIATVEKGAMAYHFNDLQPFIRDFGFLATVGGASGMLTLVNVPGLRVERIVGVVNATLNVIAWAPTLEEGIEQAIKGELVEPGNTQPTEIFRAEMLDLMRKWSIIFNVSGLSKKPVTPDDFSYSILSEDEIRRLFETKRLKMIVEIRKRTKGPHPTTFPGFYLRKEDWEIAGEFKRVEDTILRDTFPKGAQNTLLIQDATRIAQVTGIGAGTRPTAGTVYGELRQMVESSKN